MIYVRPQLNRITDATTAICLDNSLIKSIAGADLSNPHQMTPPAYSASDED